MIDPEEGRPGRARYKNARQHYNKNWLFAYR